MCCIRLVVAVARYCIECLLVVVMLWSDHVGGGHCFALPGFLTNENVHNIHF